MAKKEKAAKVTKAKRRSNKLSWKGQLLLVVSIISAAVMLPITILLFVGMMPTLAASFMDRSRDKMKVFTVGSLNFATCFPFVLDISTGGFKSDQAINLITDAQNIIIMFSGAVAGYLLEWATVGVVATIVIEQARGKIKSMRNTQEELVERWGKEVRGDIPLDSQGFAIELPEQS